MVWWLCEARFPCFLFLWCIFSFFLVWSRKNQRVQGCIRSFLLKEKNQKFKAHTTEATVLVAALKSRKTRLRLKQPRFFNAPLGRPLNASSVRPKQLKMENGELRIESSFGTGFYGIYLLNKPNASRGAACCASIPTRQDKTINNTINPFVFYWLLFGCAEHRFEAQQRYASTVARQVPWINEGEKENCQSSILNCQLDRPRSGER